MPRSTPLPLSSSSKVPIGLGRRFYQIAVAVSAEVLEGEGLTSLQFAVLIHLTEAPGIDQNTLARRMALDRTSTSALVQELEGKKLVTRSINGADRRARVLRLTPAGRSLHARLRPRGRAAQARILSVLTPAERSAFIDMLVRVIEANQAYVRPGADRRRRRGGDPSTVR
jgi:MarR family transcriptional regulator, lower aerobic nicotinate degradation pathway regulator